MKLTEHLVLSKTRVDNLHVVKSLNAWGAELTDVSILSQMPNVEILSLPLNSISTLRDFRGCPRLTELYIRKNNIASIWEVKFLQRLNNLKAR
jgi:Leucine-rich repeat (LRR) protein